MTMNGYELSRRWFDWAFANPELISPNHSAIYFFAIEHNNRLGWRNKFGFPTQMAMDAIGIKKHQTYIRYFNDLVGWGFFKLVQKSTNQYSANIISLTHDAMLKNGKALDKAIITHAAKQTEPMGQSTGQSNSSIDKPLTNKPYNHKIEESSDLKTTDPLPLPSGSKPKKPTKEELKAYVFLKTQLPDLQLRQYCKTIWEHYTEGHDKPYFVDAQGNVVRNWKQKVNTNWLEPNKVAEFKKKFGINNESKVATSLKP
jgi:hypothetical protein